MLEFPEELELDLLDLGLDFRDWFRPAGDPRRLSTRRLLLIVDKKLDRFTSLFWSAVYDREPVGWDLWVATDIFSVLTGKDHPVRTIREDARERAELEAKKERMRKAEAFRQAQFAQWGVATEF